MKRFPLPLVLFLALLGQFLWAVPCRASEQSQGPRKPTLRKASKHLRNGCRTAFIAPDFQEKSRRHQVIAILPVQVNIAEEVPGGSSRQLRQRAMVEAKNFYRVLFAFLQKQNSAHARRLEVQDIAQTQRLLEYHNLNATQMQQIPPTQLASLLGVDVLLFCQIDREERLVGEANLRRNLKRMAGLAGPSAGVATAHLYDGKTNEKLWQFEGLLTANLGKSMDQTIRSLSSLVAHRLPYF